MEYTELVFRLCDCDARTFRLKITPTSPLGKPGQPAVIGAASKSWFHYYHFVWFWLLNVSFTGTGKYNRFLVPDTKHKLKRKKGKIVQTSMLTGNLLMNTTYFPNLAEVEDRLLYQHYTKERIQKLATK
jgi:hypothetical protein